MQSYWLLIAIIIPLLCGGMIPLIKFKSRKALCVYTELIAIITSIIVFAIVTHRPTDSFILFSFTGNLTVEFRLDGAGTVFATLIAFLWPLATLYSFEYMTKEEHENIFYCFYIVTYGVTLGIAMADDILTLYCFYELLTLVTVPLIMHTLKKEAILATRKYLYYSIGGAAFAFIGMVFIEVFGNKPHFVSGGVITPDMLPGNLNVFLLIFVLTFMGFGVKAAVWPLSEWLPTAGVAPTPVTALLHAVAVVNSGVFGMIRLTYYCYDLSYIRDTWAQLLLMIIASITVVYGCSKAVKERHFKRRLAYSTVGNLSYMVFAVTLMSPLGLIGALMHFVSHSFMKITSFFCAGAVIHQTEKTYIYELDGLGRKMPVTFAIFTISSLALMGVPGLSGFVSKLAIAEAAVDSHNVVAYIGIAALLVSALLTAIYMMTIVVRAFYPIQSHDNEGAKDPNILMIGPLIVFTIGVIVIGLHSQPLYDFISKVANGLI